MQSMQASDSMKFQESNGWTVEIEASVIELLQSYKQSGRCQRESCGILFGTIYEKSKTTVINRASGIIPGSKRSRHRCHRPRKKAQELVNMLWEESKGTVNYLGEWHTHPERNPTPSGIDLKNWDSILKWVATDSERLYFLIVGTDFLQLWVGDRKTKSIQHLELLA